MAIKTVQDSSLTSVANAIRTKGGTSAPLEFPTEFISAIQAIPTSQPTGTKSISITQNGTTTEDVEWYKDAELTVNVPNTYTASDEGKVVLSGTLVGQTSRTVSDNGTYDTTTNNQIVVNNEDYSESLVAFGVTEDLADGIEALTTYSNEVTGESDTTLSDAVRTLADGYDKVIDLTQAEYDALVTKDADTVYVIVEV